MLLRPIGFLLIAFIAAVIGFDGIAGQDAWIAKTVFFLFLLLAVFGLAATPNRREQSRREQSR
jgi:uncharacterized membrane protein YtjA (UPF0391 family)